MKSSFTAMISASIALSIVLGGCGSQAKPEAANADAAGAQASQGQNEASGQSGQNQNGQQPGRGGMSQQTMKMNMVFRSLLSMEKTEGLSITKEQAEYMLPLVQDAITKSELSDDNQTKLMEKLSAEQKTYINEAASRTPGSPDGGSGQGRPGGGRGATGGQGVPGGPGTQSSQGAQGAQGAQSGQSSQGGQGAAQSTPSGQGAPGGPGAAGEAGRPGGGPNMVDSGQQLVELLQTKMKG